MNHFRNTDQAIAWVLDDFMPRFRAADHSPAAHMLLLPIDDGERLEEAASLMGLGAWWRDIAAEVETIALEG